MEVSNGNEAKRLTTLHSLAMLDTDPNPAIDGIVKAAAGLCDAPIALVTLVDENRQWFKANFGLDGVSETGRDIAFCDKTIQQDAVMVIEDALLDPRFANNPLVTDEIKLRFYAGAPLVAKNGMPLGALCILDRKPKALASGQIEALERLASVVVELIEEESSERERHRTTRPGRGAADDKRTFVVEHATKVLYEQGIAEFSVRKVAIAADMSLSNIQHYYRKKEDLLVGIVKSIEANFYRYYEANIAPIANPTDRYLACAKYTLNEDLGGNALRLLREVGVAAEHSVDIAAPLAVFFKNCRNLAASILREANPSIDPEDADLRAGATIALLTGATVYLESSNNEAGLSGFREFLLEHVVQVPFS